MSPCAMIAARRVCMRRWRLYCCIATSNCGRLHFPAIRPAGYNRVRTAIRISDTHAATGLPRPRPRPRALHRRRAGARRGALRAALAAADADPPPGAGGAAAKATSRSAPTRSWTARRGARPRPAPITIYRALDFLRDNGLVHRIESRNAFVACVNNHATGDLVVFLICEHCGAVGEAAVRGGRRSAQGRGARARASRRRRR